MPQYGNIDRAILGLKVDNDSITRVLSKAAQEDIEFGYPVFSYLGDEEKAYAYHLDTAKVVFDADFVTGNLIDGTVNTVAWTQVPFNGTHDDTMDDLVAAISALDGVDAALDPNDVNNRTVFVRTVGLDNITTAVVTGGATQPVATITYQSDQVFIGVALFIQKNVEVTNDCKYYQYQAMSVLNTGIIWAILYGDANIYDDAYLVESGAEAGKFDDTAGLDINCNFRSNNYTNPITNDIMAQVEVNGSKKLNAEIAWS